MGKILPFRRRQWTEARDYGAAELKGRVRWPEDRRRYPLRTLLFAARPFVLLAILFVTWAILDPALVEPPTILAGDPEQVSEHFTRCGPGRGHACVIDGDTFKIGERKVRIIGIDAPETHPPRCAEEARLGEEATEKLEELLNRGAFEMVAPIYRDRDRYGRDLRVIRRTLPDGGTQSIADDMRESGLTRRYLGGLRGGWC